MKNIAKFILILVFGASVFSQSAVVPIVTDGVLLGGVRDGKWLSAEQTFPNLKDQTQFILISPRGTEIIGSDVGRKTDISSCSDFPNIEIKKKSSIAIGAAAIWNPLPRPWKRIPPTDKNVQKAGVELLKSRKIIATKIDLRQASEVDIDGDGATESLITADFYENKDSLRTRSIGDYSFVFIRKIVNGQPQNILVDGSFFTKGNLSGSTDIRSVAQVADLNGDGIMEIVLIVDYEEHSSYRIYQLIQNRANKVLEVVCGV